MQDNIFTDEQNHLTELYDRLINMKTQMEAELIDLQNQASEEKNTVSDDLQYDFVGIEESQETLIEFETMSRAVEELNISSRTVSTALSKVNRLLPRPYFARINVQFPDEPEEESYYIGTTSVSNEEHEPVVIDWRSPIAEVYYNQQMGETSYEVDGRKIPVDLKLRRQFDIEGNVLKAYFDTKIALEDPLLIHSLTRKRTDKMQSITETIQKEQNAIIRHPDVPVLLVQGIAGSGKTSVLLQRIAYLFYRRRHTLRPNQVCLVTLNPVFQQYIDHVLPEMGEANPTTMTWSDFLDSMGVDSLGEADITEADSLHLIDEGLVGFRLDERYIHGITLKHAKVLDKKQIAGVLRKYKNTSSTSWIIQTAVEELQELARKNARKMEKKNKELDLDSVNFDDQDPDVNQFGGAAEKIRNLDWLDINAIGKHILGKDDLTPAEYTYLKLSLTGISDHNTRYVIVDEVQDYTEAQIMLMTKYFKNAHFMMLGDEFQSIHSGTATFGDLDRWFTSLGKEVTNLSLLTSYRSSPEITGLFTSLLPKEIRVQTNSVQREGIEPEILACDTHEAYEVKLRQVIAENTRDEGLTAVICEDWTGLNMLNRVLGEDAPHTVRSYEALPKSGVVLMELKLAKGLEFDTVILPDVTKRDYPEGELFRHRLYTAMSRATEKLIILSDGELSPLVK
ncbi:HelD family protein [Oribacterium sp. WCC10]|uniref:HelD family protein n=1 Tax=Oribacterium sp. WCC10 TaxID=1855343 RepID=UPI0008F0E278|nr:UvrD-helicase domain-containing protein [Oribacterium sp. WCC10]SFG49338.1 DNA helicase-2 / ATP-dependent DNA helicase PcrA [Oribacterium sp. WCC10]